MLRIDEVAALYRQVLRLSNLNLYATITKLNFLPRGRIDEAAALYLQVLRLSNLN